MYRDTNCTFIHHYIICVKISIPGKEVAPEDKFWIHVMEITKSDRNMAIKEAERIRKLYIDVMNYYKELDFKEKELAKEEKRKVPETMLLFRSGDINISLPKTDSNIDILIDILTNLRSKPKQSKRK